NIEIIADEPDFKYRGWFNNDEDLITEFFASAGQRDIDYRYYGQVVHPDLMSHILEALVRSRYNLTIPASFVDIMNPPERRLVEEAAKRGLFISQHHVEPVGVSGFTFKNYWEAKGKEPKYSYFSSKAEIEEVWEKYIAEWSQIPNVVWQVGLRGIADSPMWLEDANIPDTDSARGALISQAMQTQVDLIKKYDKRLNPPMTSTMWAEGVTLNKAGHLDFPEGVTIVFADNNPGYIWLDDFYESKRDPQYNYGVYFHHQLWGSGPHLVQGVSPAKTYEMFNIAYEHNSHHYALMNVSNVREFILGIEASASILTDLNSFNPDTYLQLWCENRFGATGDLAHQAYQYLFNSYPIAPKTKTPFSLDGQLKSFGRSQLYEIQQMIQDPEAYRKNRQEIKEPHPWWHTQPYIFPGRFMYHDDYESGVEKQLEILAKADTLIPQIKKQLIGDTLQFFTMNYEAQFRIIYGLSQWCDQVIDANKAMQKENIEAARQHLQKANQAIQLAKSGQALASRGKWEHWYRGDTKFNMPEVERVTEETLNLLEKNI
ncbi:MAG: glycosyl hydrolase 115 family protein, partial [Candidatus Cyclobacteriaceae bacterium M3_2C_046]